MGGGGGGNTTEYEKERIGVDTRAYGKLSKTGIQSQEQYDAYKQLVSGASVDSTISDLPIISQAVGTLKETAAKDAGLAYDTTYDRYSLANGVDLDAALSDWENYRLEREEMATYEAKEARRKDAPESLTGTSGKVDYSLAITDSDDAKKEDTLSTSVSSTVDTSPTVSSTSQTLGIY